MQANVYLTRHAESRRAQRNLSQRDIEFVLDYGRTMRCAGARHVFLARRDMPADRQLRRQFERLEGTTLVMCDQGDVPVLITAYRNRNAWKQIRRKAKYDRSVESGALWGDGEQVAYSRHVDYDPIELGEDDRDYARYAA